MSRIQHFINSRKYQFTSKCEIIRHKGDLIAFNGYFPEKVLSFENSKDLYSLIRFLKAQSAPFLVRDLLAKASAESIGGGFNKQYLQQLLELFLKEKYITAHNHSCDQSVKRLRRRYASSKTFGPIYIIPSMLCNFNCPGCLFYSGKQNLSCDHRLTPRKLIEQLRFIERLLKESTYRTTRIPFVFYGGEPLYSIETTRGCIDTLVRFLRSNLKNYDTYIVLLTNGSLLSDSIIDYLRKNCVRIAVSLDGVGSSHDAHRSMRSGRGTFEQVFNNLKRLERRHCDYDISWTISGKNIDSSSNDLMWLHKNLSCRNICINPMRCLNEEIIDKGLYSGFSRKMNRLFDTIDQLGYVEQRINRYNFLINEYPYNFHCGAAGGHQLVLLPSGDMTNCHADITDLNDTIKPTQGKMREEEESRILNKWDIRSPLFMKKCVQHCSYFGVCSGSCPVISERNKGSAFTPTSAGCMIEKYFIKRSLIQQCGMLDVG